VEWGLAFYFCDRFFHITKIHKMNKGDLISKIAADASITKAQATDALNAVVDGISSALKADDKVTLVGFGTFSISKREARTGRNPQTGKSINIAAKNVVRFKPGKELADNVN
jgi:DNA-binding protein HU-beta